jgi:hypothetical protein
VLIHVTCVEGQLYNHAYRQRAWQAAVVHRPPLLHTLRGHTSINGWINKLVVSQHPMNFACLSCSDIRTSYGMFFERCAQGTADEAWVGDNKSAVSTHHCAVFS